MTNNKLTPKIGVGVLIQNSNNEVLLGERMGSHGEGEWCFPCGHLDFGETIFQTAGRELKEETGLIVDGFELISVADELRYIKSDNKHYLNIGIKAKYNGGEPKIMEPDKCKEWCWFKLDSLPDKMSEGTEFMIRNFNEGKIYQGDN